MLTETRLLTVMLLCALLPGCYLVQAAHGEMQVLDHRRPIPEVIADPATPPTVRATLSEVRAAREFASRELKLPDNHSYRTYSDVHRPYVVWNVVAAPEFSLVPRHWCFPVAGCVAYRGYFHEHDARSFAASLHTQGYDVVVEGVPAYSTLGRFADPVLSTMLPYGTTELAGMIFHELAHQLLYVPGDTSFNEAFATAVEDVGLERWLLSRDNRAALERYRAASAEDREMVQLLERYRAELERLYASGEPPVTMRARKHEILDELAAALRALEKQSGTPSAYGAWLDEGLNNAKLAAINTYYDCVPGFQRLLQANGGDLERFYGEVRSLAKLPKEERDARVCSAPDQRSVEVR